MTTPDSQDAEEIQTLLGVPGPPPHNEIEQEGDNDGTQ